MAWGYNDYGQLGLGNNTHQNTPQQIPGLTPAPADLQLTAAATATLGTQWLMSLTRNYAGVSHTYVMDASFGGTWPGIVV
ncbi:MAG: hypothetical protein EXS14_10330, partial [Planctomycetes bacterium]|nr:hypothetical protein [Planctomycetota bacterium]